MFHNKPIAKSCVWHKEQCFFVSTITRGYTTIEGESEGAETMVWEYDWAKQARGISLGLASNHFDACKQLIETGKLEAE